MVTHSVHKNDGSIYDQGGNPNHPAAKAKPRARSLAQSSDPFAPMSNQDIGTVVKRFTGMYGAPLGDAQIQARAQAQIDPLIAALTKTATDHAKGATSAINGYTNSYASELGKINWDAPYQKAEGDQAAVDAALQQSLSGAGSDLASQLKSRLSSMSGDPALSQAATGLADRGAAIGNTQLAEGSSGLTSLIAQAAANSAYGQKLPGIAKLAGIQNIGQVQGQAAHDINTGTQSVLSQLPGILQAFRSSNDSLRGNKAQAAAQIWETLTGQNVTKATAKAGLGQDAIDNGFKYAATYGEDPVTGKPTVAAKTAEAKAAAAKAATAAKAKAAKAKPKFTPQQVQTYKGTALTIAQQAHDGVPAVLDAKGAIKEAALPKLSRKQAILEMEKEGVPENIAVATVNRVYGKPLSPAQKKKQKQAVDSGLGLPSAPMAPGSPLFGGK